MSEAPTALAVEPPTAYTATANAHPCELYAHTSPPRPSRTQFHHRYPVYLQERLWGQTRVFQSPSAPSHPDMLWLCGLCHDSVHDQLSWLLGEARKPDPAPSYRAIQEATRAANWYWQASNGHTG